MLLKAGGAVLGLFFAVIILTHMLPSIVTATNDARTEAQSNAALSCATGAGEVSCQVTLTNESAHAGTTGMTVTETSPGSVNRTATSTVADDRVTVTVAGLVQNITYEFTVAYEKINSKLSSGLSDILKLYPVLLLVVIIGAVVIGGIAVLAKGRR